MSANLSLTGWKVVGSSVTGVCHLEKGGSCQDAHFWAQAEDGSLFLAVADGAGSAAHSHAGALLATETVVASLLQLSQEGVPMDEATLRAAYAFARHAVVQRAEEMSVPPRELACTLCVVGILKESCLQANIGDSAAILCTEEHDLLCLLAPQKGEYANETNFLTAKNWESSLEFTTHPAVPQGIMLGSDGLMDFLVRNGEPMARQVSPLFQFVSNGEGDEADEMRLSDFLGSEQVTSRVYDDVTLLLCWKVMPPPPESEAGELVEAVDSTEATGTGP